MVDRTNSAVRGFLLRGMHVWCLPSLWVALAMWMGAAAAGAADDGSLGEKAREKMEAAGAAVEEAGQSAADTAQALWQRVDEARLRNRTADEVVAWAIMGVVAGAIVGLMTGFRATGLGRVARLLLGLAGACLGGMVVRVAQIDFAWGAASIRYEELLFSFLGAIVLIVIGRLVRNRSRKKNTAD
ncbi:MAG: GlsB/YeaQ/YmgE family stress response membrane protein [Verrucomicrobiales bacterium]|nr:GlsB/YeaQ/YmgE family stress response membrane protein [Verrucomicrobiales bacterium]